VKQDSAVRLEGILNFGERLISFIFILAGAREPSLLSPAMRRRRDSNCSPAVRRAKTQVVTDGFPDGYFAAATVAYRAYLESHRAEAVERQFHAIQDSLPGRGLDDVGR